MYPNPLALTIEGLKQWSTHDGGGFQCSLYQGKVHVATITDFGWGGALQIYAAKPTFLTNVKAIVDTLPPIDCTTFGGEGTMPVSVDVYLEDLLSQHQFAKKLARASKTKVCFTLPGDDEYTYRTLNTADVARAVVFLCKKYPGGYTILEAA
jgi:hypothetical protein